MVVGVPIVALIDDPVKMVPAGVVVPPSVAKRVSVDVPLPDVVAVALVVGTKIASKPQGAVMTFVKVALVVPLAPLASAYAQPMNWKPEAAVAVNWYVSPVIRAFPAELSTIAVPFASTAPVVAPPNVV
jgi:hypothetical protein